MGAFGKRLGRKALAEVAQLLRPESILGWHRKRVARKVDGSKNRLGPGRPFTAQEVEELVLRLARENPSRGYKRLAGALENLGHKLSVQTVANLLRRHGMAPAPECGKGLPWKGFIRSPLEVLAAVDFFAAEVRTARGLVTCYVLVLLRIAPRQVYIAGVTPWPDLNWMQQMARNVALAEEGFLNGCRYLLHDRDTKFSAGFDAILRAGGVEPLVLPVRSPNLNACCERWTRSVKEELLSKRFSLGRGHCGTAWNSTLPIFHRERNHQGKGNVVLFPALADRIGERERPIERRERLGGVLRFYYREVA